MIRMTEKSKKDYETFEKENVLKLKNENIIAINAAALLNKLSQYANGAIYGEDGKWTDIHQEKLEALAVINAVLAVHGYREAFAAKTTAFASKYVTTKLLGT